MIQAYYIYCTLYFQSHAAADLTGSPSQPPQRLGTPALDYCLLQRILKDMNQQSVGGVARAKF